ncbi:MAG TPA: hypothetical protein VK843_13400 [Planctomycetota bacterium]|nr:hypothetical protein [Planctomycetota bacterium]
MKASMPQPFDANFEGLLREAASAPRSMLLRVEREQVFPTLRSREAPVSIAMAGLNSMERELLASYRCELGLLLRHAALSSLMGDRATAPWIDSTITDHSVHRISSRKVLRNHAQTNLRPSPVELPPDIAEGLDELFGVVEAGKRRQISTPRISAAALRVESVDQPRVYAGAHFAALGDSESSLDVLSAVLDGQADVSHEAFAREWAALALARSNRSPEASVCMRHAVSLGYPRAELSMRYLLYSALSGNESAITDAAACVARMTPPDHPSVESMCSGIRHQLSTGVFSLARVNRSFLRETDSTADPASKRIINEITLRAETNA